MATFTDIVRKQRKRGEGIGSSLATAFSERAKERLDPRNYLFNRKGLATSLFPSLKGYQAGGIGAEKLKEKSTTPDAGVTTINDGLGILKAQFRIVAKNSIVLPQMARDTNLMKQNIAKLVRAQGDTPARKADAFFQRAGERESQYENAIKAGKPTPEKEEGKKEEKGGGLLQKIFGFLLAPIKLLVNLFSSILGTLTGGLKKLSEVIGSILSLASTLGLINTAKNVVKGVVGVGRGLAAAATGAGALVANAAGKVFGGSKTPSGGVATKGKPLTDFGTAGQSREVVKNKSLWGRFLAFVERKSPKLFTRIGARLATAGTLATVPVIGWVASAIEIGLGFWTAWELYELWKEFNGLPEEQNALSPDQMDTSGALDDAAIPKNMDTSSPDKITNPRAPGYYSPENQKALGITPNTPAAPTVNQLGGSNIKSTDEILKVVAGGEGGKAGYDAANNGKAGDMPKGYPGLSKLTVGEVMKLQTYRPRKIFAAGKYQIIPETLQSLLKQGVVKPEDKFDAETQDRLGRTLINNRLAKAGNDPVLQQLELSKEFASIADPRTGKSYYAGKGNNAASIQSAQLFNGGSLASTTELASLGSPIPSTASSSRDPSFDPARIEAIANYRRTIPDKVSTQDSGKININNIDNSKKSSSSVAPSSTAMASTYNYDIINLLLDRVTNPDIRTA
jgi:hypothetical protein